MRIAVITQYLDAGGGTPTVLANLVRHFAAHYRDLGIEVIASRNQYRNAEKLPRFQNMREYLVQHYAMTPDRVEVVPNWCDPEEVRPLRESQFRREKGLKGVVAL